MEMPIIESYLMEMLITDGRYHEGDNYKLRKHYKLAPQATGNFGYAVLVNRKIASFFSVSRACHRFQDTQE